MQTITDWKLIKETVDQNFEYSFIGFMRSNLFNKAHQYFYEETLKTVTPQRKLFGCVWDNIHDIQIFSGKEAPESPGLDSTSIISWFAERNFDYLFLPDVTFMNEFMSDEKYPQLINHIQGIIETEHYDDLLPTLYKEHYNNFLKMVLARHYYFFSDRIVPKFFNKACQLFASDGTFSYIYYHFMKTYFDGVFSLLPLIRNENGLAFDFAIEEQYPSDVKEFFISLVPLFMQFRTDKNLENLKKSIINLVREPKEKKLKFLGFDYFCNEVTLNKWIIQLQIGRNYNNDAYRLWEYEE